MADLAVLDRINRLLRSDDDTTVNTSMRLPATLREAAALAADELGLATSATAFTADALRSAIEAAVLRSALDAHFGDFPDDRPTLAEIAVSLAEIDGNPLAGRADLIERAAAEIVRSHPDATPDEVLLWAEAQWTTTR
jgi:hypothetical protein